MKIRLLLALAGLAFGFAFSVAQAERAIDPQDRQQIEAVFMKFQEAFNKRDAAAIAALHTQDAIDVRSWVSAGGGLFSARQAIEEMFKSRLRIKSRQDG